MGCKKKGEGQQGERPWRPRKEYEAGDGEANRGAGAQWSKGLLSCG